jgi:hypothetical protein
MYEVVFKGMRCDDELMSNEKQETHVEVYAMFSAMLSETEYENKLKYR